MDYNRIIESAYKWLHVRGAAWFLVFFWITASILVALPEVVSRGLFFNEASLPVVTVLYAVNAVVFFAGFFALVLYILEAKGFKTERLDIGKLFDTFFLLVLQAWYIFIWNLHRPHRGIQILSLLAYVLAVFSLTLYNNVLLTSAAILFGLAYFAFVVHNCVRLVFSYFIFFNRRLNIKHSIYESWKITENRAIQVFSGLVAGEAAIIAIMVVVLFAVAAISNIFVSYFFIYPLAYEISMFIGFLVSLAPGIMGEQSFLAEVYAQTELKHSIAKKVDRILAKRVLREGREEKNPKKAAKKKAKKPKKKAAKKKPKKKGARKRAPKKKSTKKKAKKKTKKKAKKKSNKKSKKTTKKKK